MTVLGPEELPVVTDPAVAAASPLLGVLSLMAHGDRCGEAALVATLNGLEAVDNQDREVHVHLIFQALGEPMRRLMEAKLSLREQFPDLPVPPVLQALLDQAEGIGERRGSKRAEARAVLRVLARRGVEVTPEQRATIESCTDIAQLDQWLDRAVTARSAVELFD